MSNDLLVHWGWDMDHVAPMLQGLADRMGLSYYYASAHPKNINLQSKILRRAKFAVIWNGRQYTQPVAKQICRETGIPHVFMEWGYYPQATTFAFDPSGFAGDSHLMHNTGWVTPEEIERVHETRRHLRQRHTPSGRGTVLVLSQIWADATVLNFSNVPDIDTLVGRAKQVAGGREVVVRAHPKAQKHKINDPDVTVSRGGPETLMDDIRDADLVVGVTSTALIHAALYGVPVLALGQCPLQKYHTQKEIDSCLAGYLTSQLDREKGQPDSLISRWGIHRLR